MNREPGDTEEGNQTECSKTPSTSQTPILYPTSLTTVPALGVAIIATRVLFRDFAVPVSIDWWMFKIAQDVHSIAQGMYKIVMKVYRIEREKLIGGVENPCGVLQPTNKGINWEYTAYRDETKKTYHWTEPNRATTSPRSTPNFQSDREPTGTEGGSRADNPKAPSVPPSTPMTVQVLAVAITATRLQTLFWDIVPVRIDRKALKVDKLYVKSS